MADSPIPNVGFTPLFLQKKLHFRIEFPGATASDDYELLSITLILKTMERQKFSVTIDAPRETVWDILWNDETYREWTSVFSEGSRTQTDWKQGSKVLFLDGKGDGMVSTIAVKKAPEFMSFKHLGEIHNGVEDLNAKWSGAMENYTLREVDGKTELTIDMDITEEFKDYFLDTWPRALEKLKSIADKRRREAMVNRS